MTLSGHLLAQMDSPLNAPIQTPKPNGMSSYRNQPYQTTPSGGIFQANDGSQFSAHHGMVSPSPWMSPGFGGMGGYGTQGPGRFTTWSADAVSTMQARLAKQLGPEYITTRPGPAGGGKLSYIEGWKVINLANDVFGFNGWSSSITSLKTDFLDCNAQDRCCVGITAIVRVTLQDGCYHEDVGYGHAENVKGKYIALEKAQKEAVTDALKRALKHFGNVLGNCLYDKEYTKEVGKMRVPPVKVNVDDLERRPEFTPQGATRPTIRPPQQVPLPQPAQQQPQQASAVPRHVTGNSKPPPGQAPRSGESPTESPLPLDEEFMNIDDSEFGYMEQYDLDESILTARAGNDIPLLGPESHAQQVDNKPAYQHRHRPDMPLEPPAVPNGGHSATSSGPGGITNEGGPVRRPAGGFAMPNGGSPGTKPTTTASDAAARRAAIMQALSVGAAAAALEDSAAAEGPSLRIPAGDIDTVAMRAQSNIHMHSANLEIENREEVTVTSMQYGAFTSARGVKREGGQSPNKGWDGDQRAAVRAALTELPPDNATTSDWKRSRLR